MPEVIIYGASDDLVEFEGAISEEFQAYGLWRGRLEAPNLDALVVHAQYGADPDTEWGLGVESGNYPSWPIRFTERPDYAGDPAIVIEVPEGTTITQIYPPIED